MTNSKSKRSTGGQRPRGAAPRQRTNAATGNAETTNRAGIAKNRRKAGARQAAAVPAPLEVRIDALAAGGDGVGRTADGRVTFVPHSAPGDLLLARVVEAKRDYARAEPVEIRSASPVRVTPPCTLFRQRACGGCQWQHIDIEAQVAAKQEGVARALRRHVAAGMTMLPLVAAAPAYGWRRRARLHWFRGRKAPGAVIGFFAPRSHRVVDIAGCVQIEPVLLRAYEAICRVLAPVLGREGEILLLAGHQGDVHVAIRGRCDADAASQLVGQGGIAGVVLAGERPGARQQQWGAPQIELEPGAEEGQAGVPELPGRADWFAQPSAAGNQALLRAVDQASRPRQGARILELYAGSGNLTRMLARDAAEIVAVDRKAPSWPQPAFLESAFVWGDVAEVARGLVEAGQRFDVAVLDPPRMGAREVLELLIALAPTRIVYVSCDAATLARDMDRLAAAGYRAISAQPLDLMPQTAHVEVVALLERSPEGTLEVTPEVTDSSADPGSQAPR